MRSATQVPFLACASLAVVLWAAATHAGPIAHWPFDEASGTTAYDSVGTINGTLAGDATFVGGGISGNAVSVTEAGNGLVNMGDNFGFTSGDYSISAWVNTTVEGYVKTFVSKHVQWVPTGYALASYHTAPLGRAYFYYSVGETGPTDLFTDGEWHHIVGVYDDGSGTIYMDGGFMASGGSQVMLEASAPFIVGGFISGGAPTSNYTGLVDDVQLYDHALTPQEIRFLYNNPGHLATEIPEPATLTLLALGGLGLLRRRRRKP